MFNTGKKRDNGIYQSHVSFAASNEMGGCGGGCPLVHHLGCVEFRQQQPVLRGAQEATQLVLSPGRRAGPGAVWSPAAAWWQAGSQSAAGPETGQAAQDWPVSSANCFPAPAGNFSLSVL